MADNKQIKDGVGDVFGLRMRDLSPAGDGSLQRSMIFATGYPIDYGTGGMFQHCAKSGVMAAGLAANAPIYAFYWPATLIGLVRRVRLNAWTLGTAFTAGLATFDLFAARQFTAPYGGGAQADLSGDHAQLRTSMGTSLANIMVATTAALTPGTRTLDPDPLNSITVVAPSTAFAPYINQTLPLFEKLQDEHPLMLVTNEGFVIRATVPATGLWSFAVTTEWDEVVVF
jgi:hypothetical protein